MIIEELQHIISTTQPQTRSAAYTRTLLKEYLQTYVLNFIYLTPLYNKNFIFTGGTCLRRCFGLNRLSEDLDFDLLHPADTTVLSAKLSEYFRKKYLYNDVTISVLQQGRQVLLKFPVLQRLNLAAASESNFLYVKLDILPLESRVYKTVTTLNSLNNFNYIVTHYNLPSLMANKIVAILTRNRFAGKNNTAIIKGRDYFDLLFLLEKKVKPNLDRVNDLVYETYTLQQLIMVLDEKVHKAVTTHKSILRHDLLPFIDNPQLIDGYIEGYQQNYEYQKQYLMY